MVDPIYPNEQLLQNAHLPIMAFLLWYWRKAIWISDVGFTAVVFFLLLHALGTRWIYSFVPYNDWFGIDDWFGFERNMYDRFVHLMYGVLLFFPVMDLLHRRYVVKAGMAAFVSFNLILSSSAFYELFEWFLAMTLSPDQAEAYNGQQGDMWDAQKDMALAGLGGFMSWAGWAAIRKQNGRG
jgi:putative membrane protein